MEQPSRHAIPTDAPGQTPGRQATPCWGFEAFRLDPQDERLWRGAEVLPLPPKPFAVLCCLIARAGQLVPKEALLEAVWPETSVREAVLHVAIQQLRRVLGDRAHPPQFIETVHGRGYRFIAPVRRLTAVAEPAGRAAPHGARPRVVASVAEQTPAPSADPPVAMRPLVAEGPAHEPLPAHHSPTAADTSGAVALLANAEYKLVTVLCGAVADAPALAARVGPEALYRLMQAVFRLARR